MTSTEFLQPNTLEELKHILPGLSSTAVILAGGTDLMPQIRSQHLSCSCVLSLCNIPELRSIEQTNDGFLKIGAMATHSAAADHPLIQRYFRALSMACSHVGSQQIRNKGTLGGNLVNASPAGDIAPCIYLYGGELELLSAEGIRRVHIEEFFSPSGTARLEKGEILTSIRLPIQAERNSCFLKLGSRSEVTIAQISLCALWEMRGGTPNVLRAFAGAIDRKPCPFPAPSLLSSKATADQAAALLARQIRQLRLQRSRPPKLKLTEAEQLYKERAAKGIVYDVMEQILAVPSHDRR